MSEAIARHRPEVIVVNCGNAQAVGLGKLIMDAADVLEVHKAAPSATIVGTHMEAVNRCILTRSALRTFAEQEGFSEILADLARQGGFPDRPYQRVKDFMSAVALAAAGYGVVLAPDSILSLSPPGITYRRIAGFDRDVKLALAFRTRGNPPAVEALIGKVRAG